MIYTLDGRENVMLDVIKSRGNLSYQQLYKEINAAFEDLQSHLSRVKVNYADLKNALIPNTTKREIALVFDSTKTGSDSYGSVIFNRLIPLFDKKAGYSVLCGDLLGDDSIGTQIRIEFFRTIQSTKEIDYVHHHLFYIVYLNNLSDSQIETFQRGLADFPAYVGYFDMTYASLFKAHFSMTLVKHFLKSGSLILTPGEFTELNNNFYGYSFEDNGYRCHTIDETYYRLFLSFKIEREVIPDIESDNEFSLSSITGNVLDIKQFQLIIEESKFNYLLREKTGSMERSGFHKLTVQELRHLIISKLQQNYFYNLEYTTSYDLLKFNINIETPRVDKESPMKLLVSLEYKPQEQILRLITMF